MLHDDTTLILAPLDQGVRNVGGREGAAEAPQALLEGLDEAGLIPADTQVTRPRIDNEPDTLEPDLDRLSSAVETALRQDRTPVVLGGDHGTTYATVRGAARVLDPVGVAYLDVHFDLRPFQPVHTSGSSFRRLIEEAWVAPERVLPIGIEDPGTPLARERARYDELEAWANTQGIPWVSLDEARQRGPGRILETALTGEGWCFSLDADAIDEAWAPGVSAPGSGRFSLKQAQQALHAASKRCRVFDIVEYAPPLDENDRTRRSLLALLAGEA